jgi:hypothetical protein
MHGGPRHSHHTIQLDAQSILDASIRAQVVF